MNHQRVGNLDFPPPAQVEEEAEFKLQRERSAAGSSGADGGGGGGLFGRRGGGRGGRGGGELCSFTLAGVNRFEQSSTRLVLFRADKSSPARWVEV